MWRFFSRLREFRDALRQRAMGASTRRLNRGRNILVVTLLSFVVARPAYAFEFEFDNILNLLAEGAFQLAAVLTSAIVLLIDVMVPVMTYNNFTNNHVVSAGWAIVRDTVNMFFVVVLIIIAFGTIFGHSRFKWQQQVPQLMIMALVINFSKTICGIMIDFGQVIMLTFANALREIAAGNIIQLFGLNQLYAVSNNSSAIDGGRALEAFDFFAAGVLSVFMVMAVLVILLALVAILMFRIVGLWVLTVLAPMAWFMKGAEGVINSDFYKNWWAEFKCLVAIGPVLTFFLWLTLAVAAAGNIAEKSGFDVSSGSNSADFYSEALQLDNFMSFLIGCILIFASFDAAAQVCSGSKKASGFMQKYALSPAQGLLTKVASSPRTAVAGGVAAGGAGLKLAGTGVSLAAGKTYAAAKRIPANIPLGQTGKGVKDAIEGTVGKRGRAGLYRKIAGAAPSGALGRAGSRVFGGWADELSAQSGQEMEKQKEGLKKMSRSRKTDLARRYLEKPPSSAAGSAEAMALYEEMLGDGKMQKDLGAERVKKMHEQYGGDYKKTFGHDAAKMASQGSFEKANAHYTGVDLNDSIKSTDDVKNLSKEALADERIQEHLKGLESGKTTQDGSKMNMYEWVRAGGIDGEKAKIMQRADLGNVDAGKVVEGALENGDMSGVKQYAGESMRLGDHDSARKMITELSKRYATASGAEKHQIAAVMDQFGERLQARGAKGDEDAAKSLKFLQFKRDGIEATHGFGDVPSASDSQTPADYLADNFAGASEERLDSGVKGLENEKVQKKLDRADLEGQRDEAMKKATDDAREKVFKKRQELREISLRVRDAAHKPVVVKRENVQLNEEYVADLRASGGSQEEIDTAVELLEEAKRELAQARREAASNYNNNEEIASARAEFKKMQEGLKNLNPDEIEEVKKINDAIIALEEEIDHIEKTERVMREKLDELKA